MLASQSDMELVAEATNADDALRLACSTEVDVMIVDLMMPGKDGLTVIKEVLLRKVPTRILVLTTFADDDKVSAAMELGVQGFHLKDSQPRSLLEAVRMVHRGQRTLHPIIEAKLRRGLRPLGLHICDQLTMRQGDVVRFLAKGLSNHDIACQLDVSVRTVTTHVRTILDKLQVENRTQAAIYAHQQGII